MSSTKEWIWDERTNRMLSACSTHTTSILGCEDLAAKTVLFGFDILSWIASWATQGKRKQSKIPIFWSQNCHVCQRVGKHGSQELFSSYFSDYNHTSKHYRDVILLYKKGRGLGCSTDSGSSRYNLKRSFQQEKLKRTRQHSEKDFLGGRAGGGGPWSHSQKAIEFWRSKSSSEG